MQERFLIFFEKFEIVAHHHVKRFEKRFQLRVFVVMKITSLVESLHAGQEYAHIEAQRIKLHVIIYLQEINLLIESLTFKYCCM